MEKAVQSINYMKTSLHLEKTSQRDQIQDAITELEHKVIRYKRACLSCFSRPIDRQNLTDAQSELYVLKQQLVSTWARF